MKDKLHILNGHSTLYLFKETQISGDVCVWNEILSEGPVHYAVAEKQFWEVRKEFLADSFGADPKMYEQLINDFKLIEQFKSYNEVILWYEYDLFCQINLMALLSWMNNQGHRRKTTVSLICVGEYEGYNQLIGLGQLPSSEYENLLDTRITLSDANLNFADLVWRAYCHHDPNELDFATVPHPKFTYLYMAIKAHLKRFSDDEHGLNEIEKEMLDYVQHNKVESVDSVVRHMLQWQVYYGFGDMQYYYYLKKLSPFLSFEEGVEMNVSKIQSIEKGIKRLEYDELDLPLGGSSAHQYHWKDGSLIPLK